MDLQSQQKSSRATENTSLTVWLHTSFEVFNVWSSYLWLYSFYFQPRLISNLSVVDNFLHLPRGLCFVVRLVCLFVSGLLEKSINRYQWNLEIRWRAKKEVICFGWKSTSRNLLTLQDGHFGTFLLFYHEQLYFIVQRQIWHMYLIIVNIMFCNFFIS